MKPQLLTPLFLGMVASPAFSALYSADHGDIGIAYEDEGSGPEFFFHYHLGANAIVDGVPVGNAPDGEEFEPSEITTLVATSTLLSVPNIPAIITGTGVAEGGPLWVLPASEQAGVPFMGIATEELNSADWVGNITFTLGTVTSPTGAGDFSLWNLDGFGEPEFFYSTSSPASTTDDNVLARPAGGHAHYNWGFSEAGDWDIELTVAGEHLTDGPLSSTRNFTFTVVPEPGSALLAVLGSTVLLRRRRS